MQPAQQAVGGPPRPPPAPVQANELMVASAAPPRAPMPLSPVQSFTPFARLPSHEACPFGVSQELAAIEALAVQLPLASLEALARWVPQVVEARRTLELRRPSSNGQADGSAPADFQGFGVTPVSTLLPGQTVGSLVNGGAGSYIGVGSMVGVSGDSSGNVPAATSAGSGAATAEATAAAVAAASALQPVTMQEEADRLAILRSATPQRALGADEQALWAAQGAPMPPPIAEASFGQPLTDDKLASIGQAPMSPGMATGTTTATHGSGGSMQAMPPGVAFEQLDANHDGVLTREEFNAMQTIQQQQQQSAYDDIGDSVSQICVGQQQQLQLQQMSQASLQQPPRPPAALAPAQESIDGCSREEAMRQVFALQERNRQLERRLMEERAIAAASSVVEQPQPSSSGSELEDQFRAGIDNHLKGFEQVLSMRIEELVIQKQALQQRTQLLEHELSQERANRPGSCAASLAGTGIFQLPSVGEEEQAPVGIADPSLAK